MSVANIRIVAVDEKGNAKDMGAGTGTSGVSGFSGYSGYSGVYESTTLTTLVVYEGWTIAGVVPGITTAFLVILTK